MLELNLLPPPLTDGPKINFQQTICQRGHDRKKDFDVNDAFLDKEKNNV